MRQTKRVGYSSMLRKLQIFCLSHLLASAFLLSLLASATSVAYAASGFTLSVSDSQPIVGREVSVQVVGQELNDVYAAELQATFDADHLRFKSATSARFGYAVTPSVNGGQIVLAFTKVGPIPVNPGRPCWRNWYLKRRRSAAARSS